jgi:hypothetical protein
MKREDLKKLELSDEAIDKIMALHGADIEANKAKVAALETESAALKGQVAEANKEIEGFKKLDPEGVKKAADEWKAKFEQAQTESAAQMAALKFDHALEGALTSAKAKNVRAVRALLKADDLKLAEDGSLVGLKDQLEKIKSENDYLFDSDTPTPKIVTGGNSKTVIGDSVVASARKAAGLPDAK